MYWKRVSTPFRARLYLALLPKELYQRRLSPSCKHCAVLCPMREPGLSKKHNTCDSSRLIALRKPMSMMQVVSMVKNHILYSIVDAAARLGGEVLSSRAAQKAFERRSVHKYVFTVAPLHGGEAWPTQHSSDGGRSGGSGRGIAVFPELGQVVSVSGKSTLVAHRENLSLQFLRRSFLRIGRRAAWGKVRGRC